MKTRRLVTLCALLGALIASGVSASADEKLGPGNTSLGNTTVGGSVDSSDDWDLQPSGHGVWWGELKLINLGTLAGDATSSAMAINNRGEIVGDCTSSDGVTGITHAFYYRDGFMRSLSSEPCNAVAINDAGQIVGNLLTYSTNIFTNIFLPPIIITNFPIHPIITNIFTNIYISINPFTNIIVTNTLTNIFIPINPIIPGTNIIGVNPIFNPIMPNTNTPDTNIFVLNPLTNILTLSANVAANTEAIPPPAISAPTNGQIETNLWINSQPVLFRPGLPPDLFEGTNNVGFASGINNQGEIVGGPNHAFVYKNGLTMDLPELSSNNDISEASAINNHGDIVGFGFVGLNPLVFEHPFLYSQGRMQDLGTLGGSIGVATDINDVGEITGFSTTISNAEEHAFLYRQGRMIDLGGLPGAQFLTSTNPLVHLPNVVSSASAINNWGQIVGEATDTNGAIHAFLYCDGTMIDLNKLVRLTHVNGLPGFLTLTRANGINDLGQIVGSGTFWDGRHEATRAFLLNLPHELLPGMDHLPPH